MASGDQEGLDSNGRHVCTLRLSVPEPADTAWACATLNQSGDQLFVAVVGAAQRRACKFQQQDLANTAWAFAIVFQADEKLLAALAEGAERRASRHERQKFANTAWAFAAVNHSDKQTFVV